MTEQHRRLQARRDLVVWFLGGVAVAAAFVFGYVRLG
jgi:hypothetical protein